jgi:hypothetical protein
VNTVTQGAGKIGNAALFTAANDELLTNAGNLSLPGDFTISAWVNATALAGGDATDGRGIACYHNGDIIGDWLVGIRPTGAITVKQWRIAGTDTTGGRVTSTTPVTTGSFQHIVGRRMSGVFSIFHNGASQAIATVSTLSGYGTAKFAMGSTWGAASQLAFNMDGLLDEVAIWGIGLSDISIANLYNAGAGRAFSTF